MKKIPVLLLIATVSFFQYCASSKKNTTAPVHVSLTYAANVQSTVQANCSPCHMPPKGSKKPLDTYAAVKDNIGDIITRIKLNPGERGFMPFKHEKLSDSVINIFVQWNTDGLLEK